LVDTPEAADAYRRAVELAPTDAERHYLARRLAETAPATPALRATTD
jgi:predicted RNA polymerase sigma factor